MYAIRGHRKMFVKFGNDTIISEYTKSDTPIFLMRIVADGPTARSFIAQVKSPHTRKRARITSPPSV